MFMRLVAMKPLSTPYLCGRFEDDDAEESVTRHGVVVVQAAGVLAGVIEISADVDGKALVDDAARLLVGEHDTALEDEGDPAVKVFGAP